MSDQEYKRIDYDQLIYLVNYLFQKLKGSTLNDNTTYVLSQDKTDKHKLILTPSVGEPMEITVPDNDTKYGAATDTTDGLLTAALHKQIGDNAVALGKLAGAEKNVIVRVTVNGTALVPDTEREVSITIPTKVSGLTNDSKFQTADEVKTAINNAMAGKAGVDIVVSSTVPTTAPANPDTMLHIRYVAHTHSDQNDSFDEYIWLNAEKKWEKIGSTDIDLSGYVKKSDMKTMTNTEIQTAVDDAYTAVFG